MNKYILSKKTVVNDLATFYSFLIGLFIAFFIGSLILLIQDQNPANVFSLMLKLSVGSINSLSSSLNKAIPLILAGLGISIMNSVKLWNIGAEGQIFLGAIAVNLIYININISNSSLFIVILLLEESIITFSSGDDIVVESICQPAIEAEVNRAKPAEFISDLKGGPEDGVAILPADSVPNMVALVPIVTEPVITPLPLNR